MATATPIVVQTALESPATTQSTGNGNAAALPYLRPDAPDHGRFVTKAEYWTTYYEHPDASYEWNGGYLEAKPMPNPQQYKLFLWFVALLKEYTEVHDNGLMMGLETGFTMTVPSLKLPGELKETVRKPDVAFIRHDNPTKWGMDERSYRGICDLCVESLSDSHQSEIDRDTKVKKAEYEFAGVQEYFILDEENRYTKFYRRMRNGKYVEIAPDATGVIRSTALPGFQFRQRDLLTKPPLEKLALDAPYQGYVLLAYQAALANVETQRRQAEVERRRAEAEQRRAEAEQRRAEREQRRAEREQRRAEAERQRADTLNGELQQALAELARLRSEGKK